MTIYTSLFSVPGIYYSIVILFGLTMYLSNDLHMSEIYPVDLNSIVVYVPLMLTPIHMCFKPMSTVQSHACKCRNSNYLLFIYMCNNSLYYRRTIYFYLLEYIYHPSVHIEILQYSSSQTQRNSLDLIVHLIVSVLELYLQSVHQLFKNYIYTLYYTLELSVHYVSTTYIPVHPIQCYLL